MTILGIETSCDETAAAIVEITDKQVKLIANVIASSLDLHAKTGGVIPEIAARKQIEYILPIIDKALATAPTIDAIAVTVGPGLIGSLLVGVETAKTLSYVYNKPILPVNHLFGHIYANWIDKESPIEFPALALVISGGHTDLVLMRNHKDITWLGGTRDDAAGEAFDKIGRLLGLPYPAGATIEKLANKGNPKAYNFPRPLMYDKAYDFSFSGLKTAALREVQKIQHMDNETIANICASTQAAIIDVVVYKTLKAAQEYNVKSILLGGGVAANGTLRQVLETSCKNLKVNLFVPDKKLCTDNGAMIAAAGYFQQGSTSWPNISANPELYFD